MENFMETYMAIMAERDAAIQERDIAIQERNVALFERKKALAEQDMAILERDAAIAECNAILEGDDGVAAFYYRDCYLNGNNLIPASPENGMPCGAKHRHHQQHIHQPPHLAETTYFPREVPLGDALPCSAVASRSATRKVKQKKEATTVSVKKSSKPSKMGKRRVKDLKKQVTIATSNSWESEQDLHGSEGESNKQLDMSNPGGEINLGLNQVNFDENKKPVSVCYCAGKVQQCHIATSSETEGGNHPIARSPCQCIHCPKCQASVIPRLVAGR